MAAMEIKGGRIRLIDLLEPGSYVVRGLRATGATLLGPGVMALVSGKNRMSNCAWELSGGTPESLFWEIDPARGGQIIGAIGLEDCVFESCRFEGLGFAGDSETIARFAEELLKGNR